MTISTLTGQLLSLTHPMDNEKPLDTIDPAWYARHPKKRYFWKPTELLGPLYVKSKLGRIALLGFCRGRVRSIRVLFLAETFELVHLVLTFLPGGFFEFFFGPGFSFIIVVHVCVSGSWLVVCGRQTPYTEEVDIGLLCANQVCLSQAHEAKLHAEYFLLVLRQHRQKVRVKVISSFNDL